MPWKRLPYGDTEKYFLRNFKKRARFLIDEHLTPEVARSLQAKGYNALTVREAGLAGRPDEDVLAYGFKEKRFVVTQDEGMLNERRHQPNRRPGVVVLDGNSRDLEKLVRSFLHMCALVAPKGDLFWNSTLKILANGEIIVWGYNHDLARRTKSKYKMGIGHTGMEWVEPTGRTRASARAGN